MALTVIRFRSIIVVPVLMAALDWSAEAFAEEALDSYEEQEPAQLEDYDLLKCLARLFSKTSNELSKALRLTLFGALMRNLSTPFLPLQRLMRSKYATRIRGSHFYSGHFGDLDNSSNVPVVGGFEAILDLVREVWAVCLDEDDIDRQTSLHMAVSLGMEGLGLAILKRIDEIPKLHAQQIINRRDRLERTVLEKVIWFHCLTYYIEHLILFGAEVDPVPLHLLACAPLQAAVCTGSLEVVDLLLRNDAEVDRVSPNTITPPVIATNSKRQEIVRLIESALERKERPAGLAWEPP